MMPGGLDETVVHALLDAAIQEDVGQGDLTSHAVIPVGIIFEGVMVAREDMVCAGLPKKAIGEMADISAPTVAAARIPAATAAYSRRQRRNGWCAATSALTARSAAVACSQRAESCE